MNLSIPSRFRKSAFDRFAPYIGQLLKQFPRALVIDPSPLTPDSFASAFRAALRGKREHHYCRSDVDEMLWLKHNEAIVVSMRADGQIVIGDAFTVKEPTGANYGKQEQNVIELLNNDCLEQICGMLSRRVLRPAISFRVRGVDSTTRARLEEQYDIAFYEDTRPDTFIIL
jgi:hypothetical protein